MIGGIESLLLFLLVITAIPVTVFFVQVIAALSGADPETAEPKDIDDLPAESPGRRPRIAVLVPAHNEAAGIAATLANLAAQLSASDRLMVVADNCTDDTAQIARDAGAEVAERDHSKLRGKGYALDFGVRCLDDDPPEVVVVVDADCLLKAGALDRIARKTAATGRPVQALYLMLRPEDGRMSRLMAEFAWIIKNKVRPLGFHRLGLPCQLMGSGMSFPWPVIVKAALANDHIVEDLKLGLELARQGLPPLFCPEAKVVSYFPASEDGATNQRTRWEHGHLGMIASDAPGLLATGILTGKAGVMAMALDLSVPPLSFLALWTAAMCAVSLLWSLVSGDAGLFITASGLFVLFSLSIVLCWLRFGRHLFGVSNVPAGFCYIFGKIPLYYNFFVDRQVEWVRSKRDTE